MLYPMLRRTNRVPNLWSDMFNVRNEFDRLWDRWVPQQTDFAWMPAVDVRETTDELLVEAELPGLEPSQVDVRVENGVLTIAGEKKHEVEEGKEGESYHVFERHYGRFERSFTLPRSVNPDAVKAQFSNGILTIHLPKAETAKPRRIQIEAGNGVSNK